MSTEAAALATFATSLIPGAVAELSSGYRGLVTNLRRDIKLRELVYSKGIDAAIDADGTSIADLRKRNSELVTIAEKRAEKLMRDRVRQAFPDHAIVGEELGKEDGTGYTWVFDPIDGTSAMVRTAIGDAFGIDADEPQRGFGITVAVVAGDDAVVGVVAELRPQDEGLVAVRTWVGAANQATTMDGEPVVVRPGKPLSEATLACTVPEIMFRTPTAWARFQTIRNATKFFVPDQNCIGFMGILDGRTDIVMEADLTLPDAASLIPILRNASVRVTDTEGFPVSFEESKRDAEYRLLAAPPDVHAAALRVMQGATESAHVASLDQRTTIHGYSQKFPG